MRRILQLTLAAALAVPAVTMAAEEAAPNTGALTLSGGVDIPTEYVFRGGVLQDEGFIAQPWATLTVKAYDQDGIAVLPYVGIWESLQSSKTSSQPGSATGNSTVFETDYYGGVDLRIHEFTVGVVYTFYTYPGDAFSDVQELGLKLGYNDSKFMKDQGVAFTLNPYVAWYIETDDASGGGEQQYFELGLNPSYAIADTPITLGLPIAVGLTPDGYFTDDAGATEPFGFLSIGATASYALPLPARYGAWSLNGGVYYYYLNADSLQATNDGDSSNVIAKIGLSFVY